jgi:hypothetical protein
MPTPFSSPSAGNWPQGMFRTLSRGHLSPQSRFLFWGHFPRKTQAKRTRNRNRLFRRTPAPKYHMYLIKDDPGLIEHLRRLLPKNRRIQEGICTSGSSPASVYTNRPKSAMAKVTQPTVTATRSPTPCPHPLPQKHPPIGGRVAKVHGLGDPLQVVTPLLTASSLSPLWASEYREW